MEEGDSILDAIYDEDYNLDDDDVDMIDVEEGEFVEPNSPKVFEQSSAGDITEANQESRGKTSKSEASKKKKKKNKKRKRNGSGSGSNVMNIDRFVLDTCRHLKEKKSYMVYTAVGCLGIPALSDIIKEACGGQKTVDGRRFRSGGGILWNIIKVREPKVHKEIMKRAKEFEGGKELHKWYWARRNL